MWRDAALRENQSIYPNYGKNNLNSPDEWWSRVVNETFKACAAPGQKVPQHLASDLINRFSGSAFYHYMKSVPSTIKTLRNIEANSDFPVIIGVISNSDPRIASILRSLGFSVGDDEPMRHIQPVANTLYSSSSAQEQEEQRPQPPLIDRAKRPDFDFVLASYDAEYQKPEREIFGLAERYAADMMRRLPAPATHSLLHPWPYPFYRLHVGDDINKDAVAAANAGWKALVYEDHAFLRYLHPEEEDALSRDKTPRCIDLMRGVKKIVNDWCELQNVEVEISEDSKEGRERLEKEARRREHQDRKKLELDPEKLAAVYERAVEEQMRQSTPEKYDAGQVKYTAPSTPQQQSSGSEDTIASPSSSSPSSSSSSPQPPRSRRAIIKANSAEWRATGVKSHLTNESTSFLRPSNLQAIRENDTPPKPEQQQEQQITQSLEVRQQRALQRKRGKLLKRLPEMQHVPIFVPDSAVNKWKREKKKMLDEVAARREEKLQRQQGFKSDMDADFDDGEYDERSLYGDKESRSKPVPSLEDGGGGDGGAARKQEEQDSSAARGAPTPLDVDDTTKKTDSSG
ncbi:uncharacterized protein J3D65DRAFT_475745 [Phyllosticta citribraziliensis]|uniref:Uncharacterized protein n=1 Tax=Phyllosticta citribraziliensis TaxID=989973 RepID=A0ABR1LG35_9PEZI